MEDAREWLERAANPAQYDSTNVQWLVEGAEESPARVFHRRYLREQLGELVGKRILDIGAGTGHLATLFPEAKRYLGVEPSENNVRFARQRYPSIDIMPGSLEEVPLNEKFDVIIAVMVFEHIADLDRAFAKIAELMDSEGKLCIISSDYDYWTTPRFGYDIAAIQVTEGEKVVCLRRDYGVLYDIARTQERFAVAAARHGLTLEEATPQLPTDELIAASPKYEKFRGRPIGQVLLFRKNS